MKQLHIIQNLLHTIQTIVAQFPLSDAAGEDKAQLFADIEFAPDVNEHLRVEDIMQYTSNVMHYLALPFVKEVMCPITHQTFWVAITNLTEALSQLFAEDVPQPNAWDAELVVHSKPKVGRPTSGRIFDDSKNRFSNGTVVTTSTIQSIEPVDGKLLVKTRNTTYLATALYR